jgi:hypothetical protein
MQRTGSGVTGVFVSLEDNDLKTYRLTLDAEGREIARDALRPDRCSRGTTRSY